MHSKESMEVEEMIEAGILIPPYTEEERITYLDFTPRHDEWKKKRTVN